MTLKALILLIVFAIPGSQLIFDQKDLDKANSSLTVFGTSSLHDWEIEAEEFNSNADLAVTDNGVQIKSLSFTVPVKGLKSGKSAMDDNTYKALKAKDHPTIKYQLKEATPSGDKTQTKGMLTIAGVTKTVDMVVETKTNNGVQFSGSITFNMTDYGVEPPTALFGTIKTGDEITVKFKVNYK